MTEVPALPSSSRIRKREVVLFAGAILWVLFGAYAGWEMGWDAAGLAFVVVLATIPVTLVFWILSVIQFLRARKADPVGQRRFCMVAGIVLLLAPVFQMSLLRACKDWGWRCRLKGCDYEQVRKDCVDLIRAHPVDAAADKEDVTWRVQRDQPAYRDLPSSIRALRPGYVWVSPGKVFMKLIGGLGDGEGISVYPPETRHEASPQSERELAPGIFHWSFPAPPREP